MKKIQQNERNVLKRPIHFLSLNTGEVIYTAATTKQITQPTNSYVRSSLSTNSRNQRGGMTSSSSATSSNSNNLSVDRQRDTDARKMNDLSKTNIHNDSPTETNYSIRMHISNGKANFQQHLINLIYKLL